AGDGSTRDEGFQSRDADQAESMRYSALGILSRTLAGNTGWPRLWREPEPKPSYDVVIVGGGGHGLAPAYYPAKEDGARNVAVVEKGWIGSGNVGRNTTIVRSNYWSAPFARCRSSAATIHATSA